MKIEVLYYRYARCSITIKMNPQYSRFMIQSKFPYRIQYIEKAIGKEISFIGIHEGIYENEYYYYTFVQLSNRKRIYQNTLMKNFKINHEKIFRFKIENPELKFVKTKGEIVKSGPNHEFVHGSVPDEIGKNKRKLKEIGDEDISHIKYEEIISIIKSEIKNKTEEIKNETIQCSCFETPCQNCRLPKCEKCYFVTMKENHSNRKCEEIKDIFYRNFDNVEQCFQYIAIKSYCETQGDEFYNKFEKLLYGNRMNINVYGIDKKAKYTFFDGKDYQYNERSSYYGHVLFKRIEMLKNLLSDTFEFWESTDEKFKLHGEVIKIFFMRMMDILLSLNESETPSEVYKRKIVSIFKARRSNSKIRSSLVKNSIFNSRNYISNSI